MLIYLSINVLEQVESKQPEAKMNFECIIFEKEKSIGIIKLNRPRVLNAMNKQLWMDFQTALEDAGKDPEIKVLIITGEGRAFSTGGRVSTAVRLI